LPEFDVLRLEGIVTVEKIAWIVGLRLKVMNEGQEEWAAKIISRTAVRRVYRARSLVCLVLHEFCGVSYAEIGRTLGDRHLSSIGRQISEGRKWIAASDKNAEDWLWITKAVGESIDAEQKHHAKTQNLKVGLSD